MPSTQDHQEDLDVDTMMNGNEKAQDADKVRIYGNENIDETQYCVSSRY